MKSADEVADKLSKMEPFIYEIENQHYYIGHACFEVCNMEEIELHRQFQKAFEMVENLPFKTLDSYDVMSVVDLFRAIKTRRPKIVDDDGGMSRRKLWGIMASLPEAKLKHVIIQINNCLKARDYAENRFHMHKPFCDIECENKKVE